jgi:hypothetical protein
MTQTRSKAKAGKPKVGGRAVTKGERREAMVMFRTTPSLKALAERLAKAEGRSVANLLERLIWDGCRRSLVADERSTAAGAP